MPQFVPRVRKHRVRQRNGQEANFGADSNAAEILPPTQSDKKAKHDALKAALRAQQPKTSSKKQKRLDKYIETKLRKEENLELLKKLAANQVDTSLFKSTKKLGVGKDSKRIALAQALSKQRAGIEDEADTALLYDRRISPNDSESEDEPMKSEPSESGKHMPAPPPGPAVAGLGLKRPLETDAEGNPVIKKRQRLNKRQQLAQTAEVLWDGFSSGSDSDSGSGSDFYMNDSESDSGVESEGSGNESGSPAGGQFPSLFSVGAGTQTEPDTDDVESRARSRSDFKAWAAQQMNEARDFGTGERLSNIESLASNPQAILAKRREQEQDPLPPELQVQSNAKRRQVFSVQVSRPTEIQESRLKLPVVAEEQKIMEAIHNNPAVVICGATGSGKTTQVPQFLFEAGYGSPFGPNPGMIAVTQPRRVAAVTMAKRVGEEMGQASSKVAYQIRFDSTVGKDTAIKFMTDGILIREIAEDFALTKYSAVVVDEAHERSVNTDILIGMVSRIVDLRTEMSNSSPEIAPLKLIIMSATLMVESFTKNANLFRAGAPPLVQSEGRQFPVTMHFARRTQRDYVEEAFRKITRGHKRLPPGAMLVFLTGQNEIAALAKRLRQSLPTQQSSTNSANVRIAPKDAPLEAEDGEIGDDRLAEDFVSEDDLSSEDEDAANEFEIGDDVKGSSMVSVLPLYSQLPTKEQLRVFEPPPDNTRLIILATNVAETSITIPGIRYVFDCGRVKEKRYDKTVGVQSFEIGWISRASAAQRAGRAGRTGPGHCYRLYSSAIYERDFQEHTKPEILRVPVEDVVLQLKSMDLQHVVNFPFPTPPDQQDIARAENLLAYLGALNKERKITAIGQELSNYPLSPRFAKMLAIGHQHKCIYLTIATVAALSVSDLFIPQNQLDLNKTVVAEGDFYTSANRLEDTAREERRKEYNKAHLFFSGQDKHSDAIKLLTAFCAYAWAQTNEDPTSFCSRMFLRQKAMNEAFQLYRQLLHLVALNRPGSLHPSQTTISPPSKTQLAALKQILAAGFLDQVAIRADLAPNPPSVSHKPKRAIDVPYLTLFPSHRGRFDDIDESAVFVHPSSILNHTAPTEMPQYLIYSDLQRGTASTIQGSKTPKTRMHALGPATGVQLASLARGTPLLEYGKPVGKSQTVEGDHGKRIVWVVPSMVGERGGRTWPLSAVKAVQRKDGRGVWDTESILK